MTDIELDFVVVREKSVDCISYGVEAALVGMALWLWGLSSQGELM